MKQAVSTNPPIRAQIAKLNDQSLLILGLTAVFTGYFTVWLPGPAAGLRFIGLEMGEWIKFLGVDMSRNLFYLPPITLGVGDGVVECRLAESPLATWMMRGVAIAVSLLAFPAWEDLRGPAQFEYLPRIWLIGVVVLVTLAAAGWGKLKEWPFTKTLPWLLMIIVSLFGLVLPTWMYTAVKPVVEQSLQMSLGTGLGVWLNGVGHLLITAVCVKKLIR